MQDPYAVAAFLLALWAAALVWSIGRLLTYCFGYRSRQIAVGPLPPLLLVVGCVFPPAMFFLACLFLLAFKSKRTLLLGLDRAIDTLDHVEVAALIAKDRSISRHPWGKKNWDRWTDAKRNKWLKRSLPVLRNKLREYARISARGVIRADWGKVLESVEKG